MMPKATITMKKRMIIKNSTKKTMDMIMPTNARPSNLPYVRPMQAKIIERRAVMGEKHPQHRINPAQVTMPSTSAATDHARL